MPAENGGLFVSDFWVNLSKSLVLTKNTNSLS